jgi:choline kinase
MISIIVAERKGARLKNVFKKPKFLIKLGKKTVLDRQISEIKKSKKITKIFLNIFQLSSISI